MKLLVSGSLAPAQPSLLPYRLVGDLQKNKYGGAAIWLLDIDSGGFSDYFLPDAQEVETFAHHAPPGPMSLDRFTGLCEFDGRYYVSTFNEILVLEKETRRLVEVYSQPSFNDLHCCFAYEKGQVVANTGMDCIEIFDRDWKQIDRIRFEDERDIDGKDWRQVPSTKPHSCHINWVFLLDGELWCTRHANLDAVKVHDPTSRMDISRGKPHDGIVCDGHVYFTTSNGNVVAHERNNGHRQKVVLNLGEVLDPRHFGWVRGLYSDEDDFFIGTTRLRYTTSREVLDWIKQRPHSQANSAIIHVQPRDKRVVSISEAPTSHAVIFSILRF
jgi:hypothetical protein